jgi:signal transduction histidine kinase
MTAPEAVPAVPVRTLPSVTDRLGDRLRAVPAPFWVVAVAGTIAGYLFSAPVLVRQMTALPAMAGSYGVGVGGLWFVALALATVVRMSFVVLCAAPLIGLAAPRTAVALAVLPALTVLFGQVGLGTVVVLVALAMVLMWRAPLLAGVPAVVAVASMAVSIAGQATLLVTPTQQVDFVLTRCRADTGCADDYSLVPGYAVLWAAGLALPLLLGWWLARQARRAETLETREEAVSVQAARLDADAAVVAERARLARDLHDVVAHHVSLIAVRAETAPYTLHDADPATRGVFSDIAADARLALDELRGVLGILHRADGDDRSPQPTLSDVAELVERARRAGGTVTLLGDVDAAVGLGSGYAAYRLVQEALTNARRHAAGAPVTVEVQRHDDLLVRVSNPLTAPPSGQAGRGLAGMRERVEALGGALTAGAVGNEYVVSARLPLGAADRGDA